VKVRGCRPAETGRRCEEGESREGAAACPAAGSGRAHGTQRRTMSATEVLEVNPGEPEASAVAAAADVIRRGGLVAFPTETVYGLGADGLNEEAVRRVYAAKGRPEGRGLILHVTSSAALAELAESVPEAARALAEAFWPGPLTLIVARGARVPRAVCGGGESVAVRAPDHPVAQALIRASGRPIAAPSANRSGHLSPTEARHVLADLDGAIDLVLDGGPCPLGIESTIVDVVAAPPRIVRPGAVSIEAVRRVIGDVVAPDASEEQRRYAPSCRLVLVEAGPSAVVEVVRSEGARGRRVALLAGRQEHAEGLCEIVATWGEGADPARVERELFARLRELEEAGLDVIVVERPAWMAEGAAALHRLRSAATEIVGPKGRRDG
jgi:L-threonylcarbamoyladenylate synthase